MSIYLVADNKQKAAAAAAAATAAAQDGCWRGRAGASDPGRVIHAYRIGCLLHVLHIFVNAGMGNVFFMGRLGKGSWHDWPKQHLVGLLSSRWYNMSRLDVSNTTYKQYMLVVHGGYGMVS